MLKYRFFSLLIIFSYIVLLLINFLLFHLSAWFFYIPALFFIPFYIYGSAFVCSGFYIETICSMHGKKSEIALTFDDGPDPELSPAIVKILDKYDIKAAFFCIGRKMDENPEMIRILDKKGHIIGNHSYGHSRYFDFMQRYFMKKDILKTSESLKIIIEKKPLFFRPPYGVTNPALMRALKKLNFHVIGWSLRSLDTSSENAAETLCKMKQKLRPGDIILLHDTTPFITEILEDFIPFALENGYRFLRLDQLIDIKAYEN